MSERHTRRKDPWYHTQKEHWLGWLAEYDGPGYYNRVVNPCMILWFGEATGVSRNVVKAAAADALAAKDNMGAQSAAIRRHIPRSLIAENL